MLDLAIAENLQTVFTAQLLNSDEAAVGRMLNHPHSIVSLSDAGAQVFGMQQRGTIREGYAADLLLFDPQTVARGPKRRVFDLPGGAPRLTTDAVGVRGVWVNGRMVANADGLLASTPLAGELLTRFSADVDGKKVF